MTALAKSRASSHERWTYKQLPLPVGYKAYKNGIAVIDVALAGVRPAVLGQGLLHIGLFAEDMDATSVAKLVNVNFGIEKEIQWFANDTVAPVLASHFGQIAYLLDDQTVTINPAGASAAGRVWAVEPGGRGVAIERSISSTSASGLSLGTVAAPAYVSNDSIIAANPVSGSIIDVPTTAAASTVTLPAATKDGTTLRFVADGVKNGHTVQYRDAAGAVNLTTALIASKRHQVDVTSLNGKWTANAYVSP